MDDRSSLCERARVWVSLRVDGELSELESTLLSAHLERCASCSTFARGVDDVARGLRRVRLERPAPLVLSTRPKRSKVRFVQCAAAVAAIVATGAAAALTGPGGSPTAAAKPVAMVAAVDSPDRLRQLRRSVLIQQGREAATPPRFRRLEAEPV